MRSPGCSISIEWEDGYKGQYYVPPPSESHPLTAGEALSVLTPAGSWPDVLLHAQYISYRFASNVSESIPTDSTVSVPGAEFPSFIEVAIPHVKQIENMAISLGQQEYLGRETTLRW